MKQPDDIEEFLATARRRFQLAEEAEWEIRKESLDDLKFRAGEQWPEEVRRSREMDKRPCLTINRLPQFIRQVTNEQRQNRPAIAVSPVDDKADLETAEVLQGLIRHIEYDSNADVAYDTAFEHAVTQGFGYFRIVTEYMDPLSFEQDIKIKRVVNPFSVYMDPACQEADYSDAEWGFIIEDWTKDAFKRAFPDSEMASLTDWASIGDRAPGWVSKDNCRIAEYFYRTTQDVVVVQLSDGTVAPKDALPPLPEGITVVAERTAQFPYVEWCKLNAVEVLERTEWPSKWIPIVPVLGDELRVDGRKQLEGIVRHAKDPQRMYNYWTSAETETIALAPRTPFIGAEGQFEGQEHLWKQANVRNFAYLEYKPKTLSGSPLPPPQRNTFEPPVQAITMARAHSADDLKATTGVYDAALGARSNENSGLAIQRRTQQSEISNFHYIDNLRRSLRHAGRIILSMIPKVYDTARVVRIIGVDDEEKVVRINQMFEENGQEKMFDFSVGRYDVTVSDGPNFASRRAEASASMEQLVKAYPPLLQVAGDLMVKNMDWPGADKIAERLKKTLPPNLQEPEEGEQVVPPEVQQQMAKMGQMIEDLTKALHQAQDKIDTKSVEVESRERVAFAEMQVELVKTYATLDSADSRALLAAEMGQLNQRLKLLGVEEPGVNAVQSPAGPSNGAGMERE